MNMHAFRIGRFCRYIKLGRLLLSQSNGRTVWTRIPLLIRYNIPNVIRSRVGFIIPFVVAASKSVEGKDGIENAIAASDELFLLLKYQESYDALVALKDTDNVQVLWRLSRGLYNVSQGADVTNEEKLKYIQEANKYIHRAMVLNDQDFAVHKWTAIILDATTTLEGTKAKIASLPKFEYHIKRAIELNPVDATTLHMMGTYYFNIADLPWYQKKIASALFGTVPPASFEEALTYFNKAEEVHPNFYSKNLLMLGKTCHKLGLEDSAIQWLQRAANFEANSNEEKQVKKEALELLKKLKP